MTYEEADTSSMYISTDDESETPRRKVPQTPSGSQALAFDIGGDQSVAEDEGGFPTETRTCKVRSNLDHLPVI